jgi:hypothetical protein
MDDWFSPLLSVVAVASVQEMFHVEHMDGSTEHRGVAHFGFGDPTSK